MVDVNERRVSRALGDDAFEAQLQRAKSNRNRRNWILLACILIGVAPTSVAVALHVFPAIPDKWVFGAGIGLATAVGFFAHGQYLKVAGRARCPACGTDWEMIERGSAANVRRLESRTCPGCGASWARP